MYPTITHEIKERVLAERYIEFPKFETDPKILKIWEDDRIRKESIKAMRWIDPRTRWAELLNYYSHLLENEMTLHSLHFGSLWSCVKCIN